jgi:hypothetical protein
MTPMSDGRLTPADQSVVEDLWHQVVMISDPAMVLLQLEPVWKQSRSPETFQVTLSESHGWRMRPQTRQWLEEFHEAYHDYSPGQWSLYWFCVFPPMGYSREMIRDFMIMAHIYAEAEWEWHQGLRDDPCP